MSQPTDLFDAAGQRFNVDPNLLRAVFQTESGGSFATPDSSAGAMGGMQVMPATYGTMAQRYGLGANPRDPYNNVMAGAATLSENLDRYGNVPDALRGYNAGDPSRWNNPQTTAYVGNVAAAYMPLAGGALSSGSAGAPSGPSAPSYQVASNDTGTRSDVMPRSDAPPASSSPSSMSDDDVRTLLTGGTGSSTSSAASGAPPSAAPAAMSDNDIRGLLLGKPTAGGTASGQSPSPPSFWSGVGSGLKSAGEGIANVANRAAAYVDQNVPLAGSIDQAVLPALGLGQPAAVTARLTPDLAARDQANAGSLGYQVGKIGGDIALTAPAAELTAGAVGAGLAGGADVLGAGSLGGRLLQAGSNLVTGAAPAGVGRVASFVTSNAGKGVVANELAGDPSTPGSNALAGAGYGVAGGAVAASAIPLTKGLTLLLGSAGRSLLDSLAPAANDAGASIGGDAGGAPSASGARAGRPGAGASPPPAGPENALAPAPGAPAADASSTFPNALDPGSTPAGQSAPAAGYVPPVGQSVPSSIKPQGLVLTQQQASDAADRILQHFAAGGPVDLPNAVPPGSAFDAADSDDVGQAFRLNADTDSDPSRTGIPMIPDTIGISVIMSSGDAFGVKHRRLSGAFSE